MINPFQTPIDSFLDSRSYWQEINLRATLLMSKNHELSHKKAKDIAVREWGSEKNKLKFDLEEALNSPS